MNKVAIITGGSGTLGLDLINDFLSKGYCVFALFNNNSINIDNINLYKYKYNFNDEKEYSLLINDLINCINSNTIISIVHAAGKYGKCKVENFDFNECYKYFSINTLSFLCLYSKLFNLIKKSYRCNILLISSNLTSRINKGSLYYELSKSMNNQIVKHIAYEHGKYNILANAIAPGMFLSNMNAGTDNIKLNSIIENIPIKRMLTSSDLSSFIVNFLDSNKFITGEIITMDGGNTIGY